MPSSYHGCLAPRRPTVAIPAQSCWTMMGVNENTPGPEELWCPMSNRRIRWDAPYGYTGVSRNWFSWGPPDQITRGGATFANLRGKQETVSENHPQWRERKFAQMGDIGGDFWTQRQYVANGPIPMVVVSSVSTTGPPLNHVAGVVYRGAMLPGYIANQVFPPSFASSKTLLDVWGTKAIAQCKPTNNVASAAEALIELYREGLPHLFGASLWKQRARSARKKAGGEYLNYEFGFKPLANDIADFAFAVVELDRLVKQYERDAGKVVRRHMSFPPIVTTSFSQYGGNTSAFTSPGCPPSKDATLINKGKHFVDREVVVKRWFSGAFTYYLPRDYHERKEAKRHASLAQKILGIDLTPETLWNLAPWSWAVDWFTNAGDVISNFQSWANDGLVLRYGYIMEHSICTDTHLHSGPTGYDGSAQPWVVKLVTETKQRYRATPFGFGLLMSSLTNRQKAIAAALGLTRK
jgi:hypothetical protein